MSHRAQRLSPVRFHERSRSPPTLHVSGRDGQIRTADLSLRRRPLYPSELRPRNHSNLILNHFRCKHVWVDKLPVAPAYLGNMPTQEEPDRLTLLQGTLDLLILRTLALGAQH